MYDQRQMPHNNEAEQSVLGAIILDPELIGSTQEVLLLSRFIRCTPTYLQSNDEFK